MDRECPLSGNLQLYDVLEQVGRSPVGSLEDLTRALEENDEMESLVLKIQRDPQASTTAQLVIWPRDRSQPCTRKGAVSNTILCPDCCCGIPTIGGRDVPLV